MNDNDDYLKFLRTLNNDTVKQQKRNSLLKYLKDNLLPIIAIIISIIALFN